jgi:hypothetical protein
MARILYFSRNAQGNAGDLYLYGRNFVLSLKDHHEVMVTHFVVDDKIASIEKFPKDIDFYRDITDIAEIESFNPDLIFFEGPIIRGSTWAVSPLWLDNYLEKGGCIVTEGINLLSLQSYNPSKDMQILEEFFQFIDVYPKGWIDLLRGAKSWHVDFPRVKGQIIPDGDYFPELDYYHSVSIPSDVYRSKWTHIWEDVKYLVGRDAMPFELEHPRPSSSSSFFAFTGFAIVEDNSEDASLGPARFRSVNRDPIASVSLRGCGYLAVIGADIVSDHACTYGVYNHKFLDQLIQKILDDSKDNVKIRSTPFGSTNQRESLKPAVISTKEENLLLARELIDSGEGFRIEFKKSFLKSNETQDEVMNQISGFANSEGGYLMVGVEDDKTISGVDSEIKQAGSKDGYSKRVVNIAKEALFPFIPSLFVLDFVQIEEKTVLVIRINASNSEIVFRKIKGKSDECYVRTNSGIQKLDHQGLLVLYKKRTNDQK